MRFVAVMALLAGCSFDTKVAGTTDADNPKLPDAPPGDTTPVTTPTVRRIDIAPDKVTGTHTDFPVLFTASITSAHPMGYDIFFSTDQAGANKLAHEIERYQPNELVAWIKVPSLAQTTQLYLHYGETTITTSYEDPAGVWTANYAAVWHLSTLADATTHSPATATGTTAVAGKIANARGFNGTTDRLDAGSDTAIDNLFTGGGTMETWFNAATYGQDSRGRIFDKGGNLLAMCAGNTNGDNAVMFGSRFSVRDGLWCTAEGVIGTNQWIYVAVTYDDASTANDPTFYVNGTARALGIDNAPMGGASSDGGQAMLIGDAALDARAFDGRIDEARLSTVRRSADWIKTTYENQRDPAAFFVLSPAL